MSCIGLVGYGDVVPAFARVLVEIGHHQLNGDRKER